MSFIRQRYHRFGVVPTGKITTLDDGSITDAVTTSASMKGKYPNGLRAVIEQRDIKPADLARAAETAPQNIHRFLNGERKLTKEWAERLAPHIPGASPAEIIFAKESNQAARSVRLGDLVSAGQFAEVPVRYKNDDDDMPSVIEALPDGEWIAFDVVGDSMNLIAPEGSRIFVDRRERELLNGHLYVVAIDDSATFKRFRTSPPRLEPESSNTKHQTLFFSDEKQAKVVGRVRKLINNF